MTEEVAAILSTWRVNNNTNLLLLESIPKEGLLLQPSGPRARNIAQVLAHLHQTRIGWTRWHDPASTAGIKRFEKGTIPSRADLKRALKSSADMVESFLERAFQGKAKIKSFQKQPLRFMTYLIMHEAHHRGQIIFALKQAGIRLPRAASENLWKQWFWGKE